MKDIITDKCKNIIENNNATIIKNILDKKLKIRCQNGHIFIKQISKINYGRFCKKCRVFINENICKNIFESLFNCKFNKCRPDWLKNPNTNRNLELDGFNECLKLAFEYDGEFHYKRSKKYSSKKLLKQQERDIMKDELCKINNITLIRIPYTIKKEDYQTHIMDKCKINNIIIININKVDIKKINNDNSILDEIIDYVKQYNIRLITKTYSNSKTKLEYECLGCNIIFLSTYYNFKKRKNKCKICKVETVLE